MPTTNNENVIEIENGLTITEIRIWPVRDPEASRIKAMVTVTFNDVIRVNSCKLIEGAKGLFVSFPSQKNPGTEEWVSFVHPVTRNGSNKIQEAIVRRWNEMLAAAGPQR